MVKSDPKKWVTACRKAKYVVDYIFDSTFDKYDISNILHKKQATKELLAVIQKIADPVEKEHYLNLLAARVGVSVGALSDALAKIKPAKTRDSQASPKDSTKTSATTKESREEHALSMLLLQPQYVEFFFNKLKVTDFEEVTVLKILTSIFDRFTVSGSFDLKAWKSKLEPSELKYVNQLMLRAEDALSEANEELLSEEIFYTVIRFKHDLLDKRKRQLNERLIAAEKGGDKKLQAKLLQDFQKLIEEERNI